MRNGGKGGRDFVCTCVLCTRVRVWERACREGGKTKDWIYVYTEAKPKGAAHKTVIEAVINFSVQFLGHLGHRGSFGKTAGSQRRLSKRVVRFRWKTKEFPRKFPTVKPGEKKRTVPYFFWQSSVFSLGILYIHIVRTTITIPYNSNRHAEHHYNQNNL